MSDETRDENLHGWGPLLAALQAKRSVAREMGGAVKLEKRRAAGALNARERIQTPPDPGSFR